MSIWDVFAPAVMCAFYLAIDWCFCFR